MDFAEAGLAIREGGFDDESAGEPVVAVGGLSTVGGRDGPGEGIFKAPESGRGLGEKASSSVAAAGAEGSGAIWEEAETEPGVADDRDGFRVGRGGSEGCALGGRGAG